MAVSSLFVEGFSLTHAAILDGTTGAEAADIYGVRTGTIAADTGNFDNTGDDAVLSTWNWINFATVTVQGGYVPFETVSLLTGAQITSSAVGSEVEWSLPLWTISSLNQPARPVLIRLPAKDRNQNVRTIDYILYRVQFGPISFDGPQYKSGLTINYTGRAVLSDVDEKGQDLPERAIGRIVNRPGNI